MSAVHREGSIKFHLRSDDGDREHGGLHPSIPYTIVAKRRVSASSAATASGQHRDSHHGSAEEYIEKDSEYGGQASTTEEDSEQGGKGGVDDSGTGHALNSLHPCGYASIVTRKICRVSTAPFREVRIIWDIQARK